MIHVTEGTNVPNRRCVIVYLDPGDIWLKDGETPTSGVAMSPGSARELAILLIATARQMSAPVQKSP